MATAELSIRLEAGITGDMLDLPWESPLAEWPPEMFVELPRGISRHVVRFIEVDGTIMALKEITEAFAEREFHLLRQLQDAEIPAVHGVGVVTGRSDAAGEPLPGVLITEYLTWSIPYRSVYSQRLRPDTVDRLLDALVLLVVRLHLVGFLWNDCSLSNVLFRRDAGAFAAYLVDAETGEFRPSLSGALRGFDVETAHLNIAGGLLDLQAGQLLPADIDPIAIADEVPVRYERLWAELTEAEHVSGTERWRVAQRVERLNELGFDVAQLDLRRRPDGSVRIQPKVVDPGYHSRRLLRLVGLEVGENQARRLLNDLDHYLASRRLQRPASTRARRDAHVAREDVIAAHSWLSEVYEPVVTAIPPDLRSKLEDAEVFHEVLEHRWYLSQRTGHDVGMAQALDDYVAHILSDKPDEEVVMPSDTHTSDDDVLG